MASRRKMAAATLAAALCAAPARAEAPFQIDPDLSLARPCGESAGCLYTWTLATRLGHALDFAERRYGPRDRRWTLLGVEFAERAAPQVWYPTFESSPDAIVVQITRNAARDEKRALYQLAHEVIHLLSPAGPGADTTVLEEGLATLNSLDYVEAQGIAITPDYISSPRYRRAYEFVRALADSRRDFAAGIRALRHRHAALSDAGAADLMAVYPGLDPRMARRLAAPF